MSIVEDVLQEENRTYFASKSQIQKFGCKNHQKTEPHSGNLPKGSLRVSNWFSLHVGSGTKLIYVMRIASTSWSAPATPIVVVQASIKSPAFIMQRAPRVFHVASALCPMRVRSNSVLKRFNAKQTRVVQAEKNDAR